MVNVIRDFLDKYEDIEETDERFVTVYFKDIFLFLSLNNYKESKPRGRTKFAGE